MLSISIKLRMYAKNLKQKLRPTPWTHNLTSLMFYYCNSEWCAKRWTNLHIFYKLTQHLNCRCLLLGSLKHAKSTEIMLRISCWLLLNWKYCKYLPFATRCHLKTGTQKLLPAYKSHRRHSAFFSGLKSLAFAKALTIQCTVEFESS